MMLRICMLLAIITIIYDEITATDIESREKHIKELENIKSDLFIKLNQAIDDSVTALKESNDTNSLLTIGDIKDLKKQVDQLNASVEADTKVDPLKTAAEEQDISGSDADVDGNVTRQELPLEISGNVSKQEEGPKNLRRARVVWDHRIPNINLDVRDLVQMFKDKDDLLALQKESAHRLDMKKKASDWIEARQKEKDKIKQYRDAMRYKTEVCPRYGMKKTKKKLSRRMENGRRKKGKKKRKKFKKYPCCRKCCKKSYMGCL